MAFTKVLPAGISSTTNLTVDSVNSVGVITATGIFAGSGTFSGNVSVAGTLTYEDVTNVDSVGLITARGGVHVGAGISVVGVSTIGNTVVGGATTELVVTGDARVTGILTVGQNSTTINGALEYPTIRPTLDLNFAATKTLDRRITFTRDSLGTYTDELGIVKYASNNVPRFDHDPVTGESLGLLIEESRTNLYPTSEDITAAGAGAVGSRITKSANTAVAPDGNTTADSYIETANTASWRWMEWSASYTSGTTYTFSSFVKPGTGNWGVIYFFADNGVFNGATSTFNLTTGVVDQTGSNTTCTIEEYPNGWYRISATQTASASSTGYIALGFSYSADLTTSPAGSTSNTLGYVWGLQTEAGSFPTSYIPTSGSTVTRAADLATINGTNFTDFYNQTEGTLFGEFTIKDDIYSSAAIVNINQEPSSSYAYSIMFVEVGTANGYFGRTYKNSSGVNISNASSVLNSLHPSTTPQKVTFGYTTVSGGELRAYWNGNYVNSSSDLSKVPTTLTNMRIGRGWDGTSANNIINAHIRKLSYYNKRLPNAQLQGLTAQ